MDEFKKLIEHMNNDLKYWEELAKQEEQFMDEKK